MTDTIPVSSLGTAGALLSTDLLIISRDGETLLKTTLGALLTNTALTGTPTAPTPPSGNASQRIANTQFVAEALAAAGVSPVRAISYAVSDQETPLQVVADVIEFRLPFALNLVEVRGSLKTPQAAGDRLKVNVRHNGLSVFDAQELTFDNNSDTTVGATVPATLVITELDNDALISTSITRVGNGTAVGLVISLIGSPRL